MAPRKQGTLDVDGRLASWKRDGRGDGRPVLVLAHGAGAPMTHPFMEAVAKGAKARGFTAVRFHFPYMERKVAEGKNRPPDRAPLLLKTWRAMLDVVAGWKDAGPVVLAGKSMGARMASMLLADGGAPEAKGAVYLGYPLHPPGRKDKLRDAHLPDVPVPQLFVSGTRDSLCDLDLLHPVLARLTEARLHVVERGDHSLATSRKAPLEGSDAWLDAVAEFVNGVV